MKRAIGIALFALCTASSASALAAPTEADRRKEAQTHFDAAMKLAGKDDPKGAIVEFRAAYDTYPSFRVLYNIGQLCERAGDNVCAVQAYQKYLRDGGADVPAARRASLEGTLPKLTKTLATITVKSNVTGGDVSVDDAPMGKTPLEPFVVSAGAHKFSIVAAGKTTEQSVKVLAGESPTVTLDLSDPKADPAPIAKVEETPPEPAKEAPAGAPKKKAAVPIVPWAVTGGLGVATIVTGIFAATSYGSYKDKRDSFPVTKSELDSSQSTARTLFIVTTVLGAATIVAAGVSGYLTVTTKQTGARTGVRGYAGLGGVGLVGAFE